MKKTSVYIIPFIAVASASVQAMDMLLFTPLTTIEKQLVQREIHTRGIKSVEKQIEELSLPTLELVDLQGTHRFKYDAMKIKATFYKNEIPHNPLAHDIFNAINDRETNPTAFENLPLNHVSENIRYAWLEENRKRTNAVKVTAKLSNIVALRQYLAEYEFIHSIRNTVSTPKF